MAFVREQPLIPTSIADISVVFFDPAPGSNQAQTMFCSTQIVMSDGSTVVRNSDLMDVISTDNMAILRELMAVLRQQAIDGLLPEVQPAEPTTVSSSQRAPKRPSRTATRKKST
jgi:hypothetical protein